MSISINKKLIFFIISRTAISPATRGPPLSDQNAAQAQEAAYFLLAPPDLRARETLPQTGRLSRIYQIEISLTIRDESGSKERGF
jgi:hypothetical protein